MREFGFSVTEYDAARPWIIVQSRHEVVEPENEMSFYAWAAQRYPSPRFAVQADPWELSPER